MVMNPPFQPQRHKRTHRPTAAKSARDTRSAGQGVALDDRLLPVGQAIAGFKRRHAAVTAAVVAVVATSLSALALAISPLAADRTELPPQRVITHAIEALPVMPQLEALADHHHEFARTVTVRGPDSLQALLARAGIATGSATAALAQHPSIKAAMASRGVRTVDLRIAADGSLQSILIRQAPPLEAQALTHFQRLSARRESGQWLVQDELQALSTTARFASGTIRSSLFAATDESGVPDTVAVQLAELFSGDIDFHRQLRKGDRYSLVYESLTADGEPVPWNQGTGRIQAAEFLNDGRLHQAFWFDSSAPEGGEYYDGEGRARKRPFLASPLEFSRVTSGFALRLHPILKEWRAHRGIDYGAPTGTAVRVVGDGVVSFAGEQPGYGKVIEVSHTKDRSTLYAHLSRIDVTVGQRVNQGATVGAVGSTGMSTGPHLHFEFRLAGQHQDPELITKQTGGMPLEFSDLMKFSEHSQAMRARLDWVAEQSVTAGRRRFE